MGLVTFPDGSKQTVNAANESSQFAAYVAQQRAQGIDVDQVAVAQAFDQEAGRPSATTAPIVVTGTPLGNLSQSIMNAVPAPVAQVWTDASNGVISAGGTALDAAKNASTWAENVAKELAAKVEQGLGVSATVAELAAVAVAAVAVFGIIWMIRHPKVVSAVV